MCTAATYKTEDFYFGRTLDYERSYGDKIVITPRGYTFALRHGGRIENHYAMIGMACVMQDYPLYYDAVNEMGLGIAGLNFVGNAHYGKPQDGADNITQFELIPLLLGRCATVAEVRQTLAGINLVDCGAAAGGAASLAHCRQKRVHNAGVDLRRDEDIR